MLKENPPTLRERIDISLKFINSGGKKERCEMLSDLSVYSFFGRSINQREDIQTHRSIRQVDIQMDLASARETSEQEQT